MFTYIYIYVYYPRLHKDYYILIHYMIFYQYRRLIGLYLLRNTITFDDNDCVLIIYIYIYEIVLLIRYLLRTPCPKVDIT